MGFDYSNPNAPVSSDGRVEPEVSISAGLTGQVTASDGHPIEGAFIQPASLNEPSHPIPEIAIFSDEDGRYTWTLLPGHYEITVFAAGYPPAHQRTTVKVGERTTLNFTLKLQLR